MFARTVWEFIEFVLNSLVFILLGLQLNRITDNLADQGWGFLIGCALAISATVIVSRFLWVFPGTWLPRRIPAIARRDPMPPWKHVTILSWAGMRGVVSLAAALALPEDFPYRDLIVLLAFTAILATLVLQGTTLEWLIRRLKAELPHHDGGVDPMEAVARRIAAHAALREIESRVEDPLEGAIAADLLHEYRDRAGHLHRVAEGQAAAAAERAARRRIRLAAIEASRRSLLEHHGGGAMHDEALLKLTQEIDLEELRIRQVLGDERTAGEREAEEAAKRRRHAPLLFSLPPHG